MKKYLVLLLIIFIYGCSVKPPSKDVIRIRLKEDPTTLDPAFIVDVAGGAIAAKLYNGLVKLDDKCNIVPDIAESWNISRDGLIYTFNLRKDVKFSDGTVLTADTVKKSFERVIAKSPRKWIFEKVSEFKILDNNTIQIKLKERFSPFISMLTMPNAYISPDGKKGKKGTDLFILTLWEHDKKLVLESNPFYFGSPAKTKKIEYQVIPEEFTAQTEFDMGNLDIMEVSPIQWAGIIKDKKNKAKKFSQTGLNTYYIGFNCRKPLFQNIKFRQALNYAIDRQAIIDSVMQGQAEPAWGPVPPSLLKAVASYKYSYLPNKSKKLLGGKGYFLENPIRLYVRSQAQAIQIAETIQYYFGKVGIRVIITPLEWSAFKKAVDGGEADMFLMSWWGDYPDPENFLFPTFHSSNMGSGGNRAYFKNKVIDEMIEKAQKELDTKKRDELYEKLNRCLSRQAPWLFLWNAKELYITQPYISGFRQYPLYNGDKGTEIQVQEKKV